MKKPGFVITRASDFRAVMDGSTACSVRWGTDPTRVRVYETHEQAQLSLRLLSDLDDRAFVGYADLWCGLAADVRAALARLESAQ